MAQSEIGSGTKDIDLSKQIVRRQNANHGEINVPPGATPWEMERLAAKIAVTEGIEIRFSHNDRPHTVTVDEAHKILSPGEIRKKIKEHHNVIEIRFKEIERLRSLIEEEKRLGILIHGKEFLDTL